MRQFQILLVSLLGMANLAYGDALKSTYFNCTIEGGNKTKLVVYNESIDTLTSKDVFKITFWVNPLEPIKTVQMVTPEDVLPGKNIVLPRFEAPKDASFCGPPSIAPSPAPADPEFEPGCLQEGRITKISLSTSKSFSIKGEATVRYFDYVGNYFGNRKLQIAATGNNGGTFYIGSMTSPEEFSNRNCVVDLSKTVITWLP